MDNSLDTDVTVQLGHKYPKPAFCTVKYRYSVVFQDLYEKMISIKVPKERINPKKIFLGEADAYLPILEYLFCRYNVVITKYVLVKGFAPTRKGVDTAEFLQDVWEILSKLFDYVPPFSVDYFLSGENPEEMMLFLDTAIRKVRISSPGMSFPNRIKYLSKLVNPQVITLNRHNNATKCEVLLKKSNSTTKLNCPTLSNTLSVVLDKENHSGSTKSEAKSSLPSSLEGRSKRNRSNYERLNSQYHNSNVQLDPSSKAILEAMKRRWRDGLPKRNVADGPNDVNNFSKPKYCNASALWTPSLSPILALSPRG